MGRKWSIGLGILQEWSVQMNYLELIEHTEARVS